MNCEVVHSLIQMVGSFLPFIIQIGKKYKIKKDNDSGEVDDDVTYVSINLLISLRVFILFSKL